MSCTPGAYMMLGLLVLSACIQVHVCYDPVYLVRHLDHPSGAAVSSESDGQLSFLVPDDVIGVAKRQGSGSDPWSLCSQTMGSRDCFNEYLKVYASLRRTRPGATAVSVRNIGKRSTESGKLAAELSSRHPCRVGTSESTLLCQLMGMRTEGLQIPKIDGQDGQLVSPCTEGESSLRCRIFKFFHHRAVLQESGTGNDKGDVLSLNSKSSKEETEVL